MERYKRGKVYRIVCRKTGLQYIGSTCKKLLSQRLACHVGTLNQWKKGNFNFLSSFTILEENDYYIELVELVPCSSNDELKVRERFHIQNNECVNKNIPLRTKEEYYEDNKEVYSEKAKIHYEVNKDERKEYAKEYYEANKEKIDEKSKEKYDCPCGSTICKGHKARHKNSIKHQNYLKKQLENAEKLLENNDTIEQNGKNIQVK